ncbi:MAG: NlpC/P60 family protein [Sporichthyaceae bacterium]
MIGPLEIAGRMAAIASRFGFVMNTTMTPGAPGGVLGAAPPTAGADFAGELARATAPANEENAAAKVPADLDATGATGSEKEAAVVALATKYLGVPYRWGGTDPTSGLDCSGLIQLVFGKVGVELPRVSWQQAKAGTAVASMDKARPGDLVAFNSPVDHIGIYIGNGRMIHAPKPGDDVEISPVYQTPSAIRRVLPAAVSNAGPAGGNGVGAMAALSAGGRSEAASVRLASALQDAGLNLALPKLTAVRSDFTTATTELRATEQFQRAPALMTVVPPVATAPSAVLLRPEVAAAVRASSVDANSAITATTAATTPTDGLALPMPGAGTATGSSSAPAQTPAPAATAAQLANPLFTLHRAGVDGTHRMSVELQPDSLGPVRIEVELSGGQIDLRLAGGSEAARDALRAALPDLRRALESAGITVGATQVDTADAGAGQHSGDHPRPEWVGQEQGWGERSRENRPLPERSPALEDPDPSEVPELRIPESRVSGTRSGIDVRV